MTLYRNAGSDPVVFRDDAPDKHVVAPGDTFTVQGDQHVPMVTAIEGVEEATVAELRERAEDLGVKVPTRARKSELAEAVAAVEVRDEVPDQA